MVANYFQPSTSHHFPDMMAGWPAYANDNQKETESMPDPEQDPMEIIAAIIKENGIALAGIMDLVRAQQEIIEQHEARIVNLETFQGGLIR